MIRIKLKREKCNGCSYCGEVAPELWEMDFTDGKTNLIGSELQNGYFELLEFDEKINVVEDCMSNCPVNAISVDHVNVGCC